MFCLFIEWLYNINISNIQCLLSRLFSVITLYFLFRIYAASSHTFLLVLSVSSSVLYDTRVTLFIVSITGILSSNPFPLVRYISLDRQVALIGHQELCFIIIDYTIEHPDCSIISESIVDLFYSIFSFCYQ